MCELHIDTLYFFIYSVERHRCGEKTELVTAGVEFVAMGTLEKRGLGAGIGHADVPFRESVKLRWQLSPFRDRRLN